ncbi:YezD family protein [Paenibacillus sp. DYY-L-2]|uniref:YezD family protein n=1 Tax=Paenibacillus sp. DYY-L-2 TaxID=3447013 RepID=UPI003F5025E6
MAKPLKVDEVWLERIAGLLNEMEFGSLNIVIHEGQIVQVERTERKRYELGPAASVKSSGASRHAAKALRKS